MKPQTFTWKKLAADELTRVYLDEMHRDFPPSELKPLSMILNSEAADMAHTWGVFEGETLVSYLLMVRPMGCEVSQLDYFLRPARLPQHRHWRTSAGRSARPRGGRKGHPHRGRVSREGRRRGHGRPASGLLCPLRGR